MMRKIVISLVLMIAMSFLRIFIDVDLNEHYSWWQVTGYNASFICLGWYLFDIWGEK